MEEQDRNAVARRIKEAHFPKVKTLVKPFSGPAIPRAAALVDIKQWKFSPALPDGQPTAMHLAVTLRSREQ